MVEDDWKMSAWKEERLQTLGPVRLGAADMRYGSYVLDFLRAAVSTDTHIGGDFQIPIELCPIF